MHILASLAFTFLFRIDTVLGALYVAPQTLPQTEYDFIVVGGNFPPDPFPTHNRPILLAGTAGNVIAARLTENPNVTVAVIEAGARYAGSAS